ncbi:MAG: hypothetical protein KA712_23330 [Myxococcales bacterium]|nr:hypothetical protein [Myxococcales bacterium]
MSSERFSNSAILNAIIALDGEISRERDMLDERELDEDEQEAEEDSFDEMQGAFREFVAAYQRRRAADPSLPALQDVLGTEPELVTT